MHQLFRLRHLLILATVLGVGILPIFACHENLGTAGNFAILGDTITTTGATVTVTTGAGRGNGNVGAETAYVPTPPNITTPGTIFAAGDAAAVAAINDAETAGITLFAEAQTSGTDITSGAPTDLSLVNVGSGAGTLVPGVYFVNGSATVPNTATLTLSGAGDYVIVVAGPLSFGTNSLVSLAGGASAANVYWITSGTSIGAGANVSGQIQSDSGISVDGATVNGKLLAAFGSSVTLTNTVTVNDAGLSAHVDVTGAAVTGSPALSGSGTVADPYVITEGQTFSYTVTGFDPDTTGTVTLTSTGGGALTNYVESLVLPQIGDPISTAVTYTPTVGSPEAGSTVTLTYTATDLSGAVCSESVVIFVNQLPTPQGTSNVAGEAPLAAGAAGTALDPFIACVGSPLTFDYTTTDPDGGTLTLDVAGENGSFSFSPTLPTTEADGSITTAVTFTPTPADGGSTFTLTFTTTDEFGAVSTEDVVIFASSLPAFGAPFTAPQIVTACVGETLQYDVVATDPDPGASLFLYADGTPVGAEHNPNFGGVDAGVFGDLLVVPGVDNDGNDARAATRFEWTPLAGDEGTYLLTYTAEDEFGCTETTTVTVIVTNPPVLSATSDVTPVAEGSTLSVCPGETLTVNAAATDADGDTIALTASGTPSVPGTFTSVPAPGMVTGTLSFSPTAGEAGNVYTVTLTATDTTSASTLPAGTAGVSQCAGTDTLTFTVVVEDVPTFAVTGLGDTVVTGGNVINACSGDAVTFRVRAEDDDESVTLTQSGAPVGAVFTPGLPVTGANAAETNVAFTAGAAGSTVITFTAEDAAGCTTSATVTVNVSNLPTLTITPSGGSAVADGATLVACVGMPFTFTVDGNSGDAAESVTLSQTGAPAGLTPSSNPLATGTPSASVLETFTPTADQGGQTFSITYTATDNSAAACSVSQTVNIRVSSLPVATATPSSITVCEGMPIEYRVRATDTDPGNVTIGTPTVSVPEAEPGLVLTHTPTLPTAGNPVETVVTATAPDVTGTSVTYTITYPITDSDGCAVSQVVTVTVLNTEPTSVVLTRTGGDADDPFGTEICYTAVVLDNCPPEQGGPNRVPGVQVCFDVVGTTGNAGQFLGTTNANGEAQLCFTPLFPGTITVIAVIDQDGDCVADAGTTPSAPNNVTVPAPAPIGVGCFIAGRGKVDASDPIFGTEPVIAQFTIDVSPKRNGGFNGKVTATVPGGGSRNGRRVNVSFLSTSITSVECSEGAIGKVAVVFGTARIKGLEDAGLSGVVPFRADVLDAGTPGVPNDRFTLTLLDPITTLPLGPVGGNLGFARGKAPKDDIKIRVGPRVP